MNKMNLYANALYLRLYRENETDMFVVSNPEQADYSNLNSTDKMIADFMTQREEEMDELPHFWNEDGYTDFESAFAALVTIADNILLRNPGIDADKFKTCLDCGVRWCSYCGMPMTEGFYLTNLYACSEECRFIHYKECYGAKDKDEATKMYLLDCFEIAGDKYPDLCTGNTKSINSIREQTGKHPQDSTLKELEDVIENNSFEVGDYAYFTNWN